MKNLIRLFLFMLLAGTVVGIYSSCADENDCSLAGRPMMYCTLYTIDPDTRTMRNDTLDSLTITAAGTDSIILNNEKEVHTLMLPLRYTSDSTIFVFHYPTGQSRGKIQRPIPEGNIHISSLRFRRRNGEIRHKHIEIICAVLISNFDSGHIRSSPLLLVGPYRPSLHLYKDSSCGSPFPHPVQLPASDAPLP